MKDPLRFRQVHLDFHTSEKIAPIAREFDAKAFARTLAEAHVDSVTCFAKCHHGWCYYPTKVGERHPGLSRDLLGEMVKACHARDIRVPAYVTVCWDERAAALHQDWLAVERDGRLSGRAPLAADGWRRLCMNTPMADEVAAITEEVLARYEVDGIFFDIVNTPKPACFCNACRARMEREGVDPTDDEALWDLSTRIRIAFMRRLSRLVRSMRKDAGLYFNGMVRVNGQPKDSMRQYLDCATHFELESLPTGGWGYAHFPVHARYAQTLGKDFMGMTGKFQKSWADFGGFKRQAALDFECFHALALGARCSVGDQLHPTGRLDPVSYDLIGNTYQSVAEKEPWCRGTQAVVDVGVLTASRHPATKPEHELPASDVGAMRVLAELNHQFQFIDDEADLSRYRLIIAPDEVRFTPELAAKIKAYLKAGGRLLASYESGLAEGKDAFALREMGVTFAGECPFTPSYLRAARGFSRDIGPTDYVMYEPSLLVRSSKGMRRVATIGYPYFNRTRDTFCSHFQTPFEKLSTYPAAVLGERVGYLASPIFRAYQLHGSLVYRTLLRNMIDRLLPDPVICADVPSGAIVTVRKRGRAHVVHVLYYPIERRTDDIDIVEDVVPLRDVRLSLRAERAPKKATLVPQGERLDVTYNNGRADVVVPRVAGHQMVVVE